MNPELDQLRTILIDAARAEQVLHYRPIGALYDLDMENPQHRRRIGKSEAPARPTRPCR